jgi:hypothetical protein
VEFPDWQAGQTSTGGCHVIRYEWQRAVASPRTWAMPLGSPDLAAVLRIRAHCGGE